VPCSRTDTTENKPPTSWFQDVGEIKKFRKKIANLHEKNICEWITKKGQFGISV
jgi:hypothetical protein